MSPETQQWFAVLKEQKTVNCCVFPYSGSGVASFASWKRGFSDQVGLFAAKLPGREDRLEQTARTELLPLASDFAHAIQRSPLVDQTLVLAGFSLGALLAYEVARELRKLDIQVPLLFAGAARAPQGKWSRGRVHKLKNDDDFIKTLNRLYSAIPQAVIADPAARSLLLPIIRADITLFETYTYIAGEPLDCEIVTLSGTEDPVVRAKHIAPWKQLGQSYRHRSFAGGHYFARTQRDAVVDTICRRIHRLKI
ncbi:MAG: alpha/beta fold hydrolase [Planctomycetota bacterium]|nr:alpha/beta fold hydrolase [Planctomycetota bacterium]